MSIQKQNFRKANERSLRYSKTDGSMAEGPTDGQTDKGDYYATYQVNPCSKMEYIG